MTQNIHIYLNIKTDFSFVCNHIFNTFLKNTKKEASDFRMPPFLFGLKMKNSTSSQVSRTLIFNP